MSIEHTIPGDYQLRALQSGWAFQRAWHRARLDLVSSVLPPLGDAIALDAAAGSGILTWRFGTAAIVSADLRVAACQTVRSHSPGARATIGNLCSLPFKPSTFERLYLLEAIEHLHQEDGRRALEELRRVARPGARCLITTPNYTSYWTVLEWLLDRLNLAPPMADAQHVTRYDARSLAAITLATGWTILRHGSFNLVAPIAGMLSEPAGQWALGLELSRRVSSGALLYVLCEAGKRL